MFFSLWPLNFITEVLKARAILPTQSRMKYCVCVISKVGLTSFKSEYRAISHALERVNVSKQL